MGGAFAFCLRIVYNLLWLNFTLRGYMLPFGMQTDVEIRLAIAEQVKGLRLYHGWKRSTLSERAGVTLASIKRFETTGEISLKSLLRIARSLHCLDPFANIFVVPKAHSIKELMEREEKLQKAKPKRGRI